MRKLKEAKNNLRLGLDVVISFLAEKHLLKRKQTQFWFYSPKEGIKFKLRKGVWDSGIIIESWWLDEYLRWFKKKGAGGLVAIDVGAHLGAFSLLLTSRFQEINVFAFEPEPNNFSLLENNIKMNKLKKKIIPSRLALAENDGGKLTLSFHPDNRGMHSAFIKNKENSASFEAKTISLEKIFKQHHISHCNILKMDCEGCEYQVLLSAPGGLLKRVRYLALEYHQNGKISQIEKRLQKLGFTTRFDRGISNKTLGKLVKAPLFFAWQE